MLFELPTDTPFSVLGATAVTVHYIQCNINHRLTAILMEQSAFDKLIIAHLVKKCPALYETDSSSPCSQDGTTVPSVRRMAPVHALPHSVPRHILILALHVRHSLPSDIFSSSFTNQNLVCLSHPSMRCPPYSFRFDHEL
jgi:hypothetical protein